VFRIAVVNGGGNETRETAINPRQLRLPTIYITRPSIEICIKFFDGYVEVLGHVYGVNVGCDESRLNNIFYGLIEITGKCIGVGLTDAINGYGVVLVVEIRDRLSGRSDESHL
jgi:hypothetical protein